MKTIRLLLLLIFTSFISISVYAECAPNQLKQCKCCTREGTPTGDNCELKGEGHKYNYDCGEQCKDPAYPVVKEHCYP